MTQSAQMERLEAVLAAYGSDPARWPAQERAALEGLLAENAAARALANEEAAFDRLLSVAPEAVPSGADSRARASLFAALEAEGPAADGGNVVPFARKSVSKPAPPAPRSMWKELSLMAAALLVGFFTVSHGMLEGSRLDPAQLTASTSDDTDDAATIALGATDTDADEEELL